MIGISKRNFFLQKKTRNTKAVKNPNQAWRVRVNKRQEVIIPIEHKSPLKAIREKCIECVGGRESAGYLKLISECASPNCPTYEFRYGKNPYHTQNLSSKQRKERAERLKLSVPRHKLSKKVSESVFNPELHT